MTLSISIVTVWKIPPFQEDSTQQMNFYTKYYVITIVLQDPGISNQSPGKYYPYDLGIDMDIFIKDDQGKPLVGKVRSVLL